MLVAPGFGAAEDDVAGDHHSETSGSTASMAGAPVNKRRRTKGPHSSPIAASSMSSSSGSTSTSSTSRSSSNAPGLAKSLQLLVEDAERMIQES